MPVANNPIPHDDALTALSWRTEISAERAPDSTKNALKWNLSVDLSAIILTATLSLEEVRSQALMRPLISQRIATPIPSDALTGLSRGSLRDLKLARARRERRESQGRHVKSLRRPL
ncbi:hypothetical protein Bbelb_278670 [Branchiostoma belcheri]|nr:hypothetical protein Bbelb_278670 [Branchiostoma belcheri]